MGLGSTMRKKDSVRLTDFISSSFEDVVEGKEECEIFSSISEEDEASIDSNTTTKSTFKDLDLECNRRSLRSRNRKVNY